MYTHLGQGINVLRDPPKSPLKKGDFESGSPLFKGGWGGSNPVEARSEDLCVHGSPEPGEASEVIEGDLAVIPAGPSAWFLGSAVEVAQIGIAAEFAN